MKGKITNYLRRSGWRRSLLDAEALDECGAVGEQTGWCIHAGRWSKDGMSLCAQHAAQAQRRHDNQEHRRAERLAERGVEDPWKDPA